VHEHFVQDGRPIAADVRYKLLVDGEQHSLFIADTQITDAGEICE
jgi:hypothetical protein